MSEIQTLIRSLNSPLNIQYSYSIFLLLIDDRIDKWLLGKCILHKQDTKNSSLDNVCCIFEDNYIFVNNFHTSCPSYQPIPLKCNNKFYGFQEPWDRGRGPRNKKHKYPFKQPISLNLKYR